MSVPPSVASPCINVCRMNAVTGLCEGCLRTLAEIAEWGRLSDEDRKRVLDQIENRRLAASPALSPPDSIAP